MPREIPAGTDTAVEAARLAPIALVQLRFDAREWTDPRWWGAFRVWTGIGELRWGDEYAFDDYTIFGDGTGWEDEEAIWYGSGDIGTISPIEETTELRAVGVTLGLSGIPTDVLDIALAEEWQGRPGAIWFAALTDQGVLVGEPLKVFEGLMDMMALTEGKEAQIQLTLESELIDLERTRARRYTPGDQRSRFPDDAFFDQVSAQPGREVKWGRGF